jgi:thymidylate kinase
LIVEFAGLPRSGKSSCIEVVRDYFLRSGHSVSLIGEKARTCPFSAHNRVEFASWTANHALSSVLEASFSIDKKSLALQDRGLFDALAFLKLLELDSKASNDMLADFMSYFANPRWTMLVNLVIIFDIPPEVAIARDFAYQLNSRPGIITNITTMKNLSLAYDYVIKQFGKNFPQIERIDTNMAEPLEISLKVIQTIKAYITR